ncbi:L,D-transpeptidase [Thiorhodococcus mannitoliphagus]|uniref:L,D-transpeptidase n=1 Tax=Thiorhodococcus mannitoliphagus TaxID=329406 RepID=A0A6P1DWF2_9GAMM|nr:L,D-transpeptidase [Thiorhodococcus mannitoliphagus]NEX22039.1 L,D-transpeptidase [Thiorhodococcus mannitoliphagus]
MMPTSIRFSLFFLIASALALEVLATPFWGAHESAPAETPVEALAPGEFIWESRLEPEGPLVVVVSLPEQRAYVYRNGVRVGVSTISSGKSGHQTPTGVFTILNKDRDHHSKTYNNAPMPFSERLTWDGVALHAGGLPGYPSSHGCVHLPSAFAERLFAITHKGTTVVIANEATAPREVVHPAVLSPVDAITGAPDDARTLGFAEDWRLEPDKAPFGPLTLIVSSADQRLILLRDGVEIGRARIHVEGGSRNLGTHAYSLLSTAATGHTRWTAVSLPGHAGTSASHDPAKDQDPLGRIHTPRAFHERLLALLGPGTTALVTDAPVLEHTTGHRLKVIATGPDQA